MNSVRKELASCSYQEKLFLFLVMLCGFCISAEYAIIRPVSQSYFLSVFTAAGYPSFWLATVPLNLLIVCLYNRFLPRIGPLRMMFISSIAISVVSILSSFILPLYPQFVFFHFCWKDVYILLMFKQLWSMVHATLSTARAKVLYGFIFGVGMCGGIVGSLIPGFLATLVGSTTLLFFTVPIYFAIYISYKKCYFISGAKDFVSSIDRQKSSASNGFALIAKNSYLFAILLLVVFMQLTVGLIDYQFSHEIELAIPSIDHRTAFLGKLISSVNALSVVMQFVGIYLVVKYLDLQKGHMLVPFLLCIPVLGQCIAPGFTMAVTAMSLTKLVDYSLFGVMREMLFVPLSLDEKYRAKAIIDVFAYRSSKALASFLLIGLQAFFGMQVYALSNYFLLAVFVAWGFVVAFMLKQKTAEVAS